MSLKFRPCNENKDLALSAAGTKVTSRFGQASAIIKIDCVITMTSMKSTNSKTRGKIEMRKQQKGFSLIELLIVVAIILIIAAIAIPNLMRARMAANDSSAAASEHTIIVGEVGYYGAYPTVRVMPRWPSWAALLHLAFRDRPMAA